MHLNLKAEEAWWSKNKRRVVKGKLVQQASGAMLSAYYHFIIKTNNNGGDRNFLALGQNFLDLKQVLKTWTFLNPASHQKTVKLSIGFFFIIR